MPSQKIFGENYLIGIIIHICLMDYLGQIASVVRNGELQSNSVTILTLGLWRSKMSNQLISEYLSTHEFFNEFSDDALKFLCECSSMREIKKGDVLFLEGEIADKFYVVRSGRISIQMPAIIGPTLEIQSLDEHQVLGWSWLISPYKWNFQTKAEEDTLLLQFDGVAILARCEQEPGFGYELLKKFAALMSVGLNAARLKMMDEWNPPGFA